ncbi:MAG: sensor histidine kinase [Acidobacteriia bacterium]|nr:sensor histidine kinase [Terriglobia bacterium]
MPVWALPPSLADAEKTRTGRTLYVLLLSLMAMGTFSLVQAWVHHWTGAAYTLGAENLCLLAALWFNRRGETEWATKVICFSELACGLLLTSLFGIGLRDEEVLLFPLMLVTAAVLLRWGSYVRFAGLVVVSVIGAGFILQESGTRTRLHTVVNMVNILLTTVVAVGLLARNLKERVLQSREAERELEALSARLIHAQEEERTRLARELHDDLAQQIAALSIGLSNLKRKIPQQDAEARGQSELIQQKLVDLSESVRRISHELHPAVLEHAGLAAALRDYCSEYGQLTGIRVSVQTHGSLDGVPPSIALCIYRITQEALQNVAKHAHVGEAEVELRRSGGRLRLAVSDRGAGIQPSRAGKPVGLGLVSIKERTRLVNGAFEIQSKPGQGTVVLVTIPA